MDDIKVNENGSEDIEKEKKDGKTKVKRGDKVEELKEKIKYLENQLARAVADYRNLQKRIEEEKQDTVKYANRELLIKIIPAFDTLFLAGKYIQDEGVRLTIRHLSDSLRDVGVERVKVEGEIFDPETMEVVTTDNGEENMVLEELRPGFTLNGKTIRPAQVKVGKASD